METIKWLKNDVGEHDDTSSNNHLKSSETVGNSVEPVTYEVKYGIEAVEIKSLPKCNVEEKDVETVITNKHGAWSTTPHINVSQPCDSTKDQSDALSHAVVCALFVHI